MTSPALTPRAWALMTLLAVIWGASFLSIRIALDEIGPFWVVAWRVGLGAAALLLWSLWRRTPLPRAAWAACAVMGFLNNLVPFGLMAWGQQSVETGLAAILNASTAIWGVALAALLLPDEALTGRKALGVGLGFAGVALAIGPDALGGLDPTALGQLAIVAGTVSYGLAAVWARRHLRGLSPLAAATGMLSASALMAAPLAWAVEGPPELDLAPVTLGALAYIGLLATAVAYLLYYRIIALAGSGNAMIVTLMIPPVGIALGAWVRAESLPPQAYGGFALLALGLAVLATRFPLPLARLRG